MRFKAAVSLPVGIKLTPTTHNMVPIVPIEELAKKPPPMVQVEAEKCTNLKKGLSLSTGERG
jgi:hypothetical protein